MANYRKSAGAVPFEMQGKIEKATVFDPAQKISGSALRRYGSFCTPTEWLGACS